jgi:hypothetical protein
MLFGRIQGPVPVSFTGTTEEQWPLLPPHSPKMTYIFLREELHVSVGETSRALDQIEKDVDRRTSNRVSYAARLGVAVARGQGIPSPDEFIQVPGSDFSHTGISFTTPRWPASDQLILQLGSLGKTVYAAVRVVGCVASPRCGDEPGRFEVRCEFERWL